MVEFIQKYVQYYPNGSGRDSYINANSGGFSKYVPKQVIHPHFEIIKPIKDPKVFRRINKTSWTFKYKSDGSGRDSYVLCGSGGLQTEYRPPTSFKNTLRGGYVGAENTGYASGSDLNVKYISKGEHEIIKRLSKIQNNVTKRLYTSQSTSRCQDGFIKENSNSVKFAKNIKQIKMPVLNSTNSKALPHFNNTGNYLNTEVHQDKVMPIEESKLKIETEKQMDNHIPSKSNITFKTKGSDRLLSARTRHFFDELQQYNKRIKKDTINYFFD